MSASESASLCRFALIVIDRQVSFRHFLCWSEKDVSAFSAALLRLADCLAGLGDENA